MLRDKFVSGLHNTRTQHRLLAEKALAFPKTQEIAQTMELADKDVQSLQSNPHPPVLKLNEQHFNPNEIPEGMSHSTPPDIVTLKLYLAIIVGESIVALLVVLKLNNVMCVARLVIFLECATTDSTEVVENVDTQQMW